MDIQISIPDNVYNLLSKNPSGNKMELLQNLGYSQYLAKFYVKLWNNQIDVEKSTNQTKSYSEQFIDKSKINKKFQDNKGTIEVNSLTISTIEQAIKAADIDLDVWEIDRSIVNSWQVTMKLKDGITGREYPEVRTNYQVKIHLKSRIQNTIEETLELFRKKLPKNPTVYPKLPKKPKANLMLEIGLVDHHFGMLAWAKETLSDYDLKIAEVLYVESVKKVIDRIKNPDQIGKIVIPIGHDFFHINDQTNQTPRAGHLLDVDGRLPKVYSTGKMAAIRAIEYCRQFAPVDVLYVSGNHDPQMSYFLCDTIDAWFKNCPDVTIDMKDGIVNPTARKYRLWGKSLVGFSHGLDEAEKDLPLIMASEVPKMWASSIYREVHIGHYHKSKSKWFSGGETYSPVVVRTLPCLSGTDSYSYAHGWLAKGTQMIESYLWDKEYGMISYHTVKAEELI